MMKIEKLTNANQALLNQASELFNEYRIFYEQPSDLVSAKNFLHERLSKNESQVFLCIDDDRAAGFMQLYPGFSSVGMRRVCILNDLYVAKEYRKKGVGRMLMHEAKNYCIANKITKLTLTTAKSNKNAQKLYESEGYVQEEGFVVYNLSF